MSAAALLDAIAHVAAERVFVARALDPELRISLAVSLEFEELPLVGGRTVLPTDLTHGDVVVAGHPNHLGVFDLPAAPTWIAVTGRWSALAEPGGAATTVAMAEALPFEIANQLHESAQDLSKRLSQLAGVAVPFEPECPVLVALLSIDPGGLSGMPLDAYPELPGGLRIELEPGANPRQYAAEIDEQLQRGEEGPERWRQPPAP